MGAILFPGGGYSGLFWGFLRSKTLKNWCFLMVFEQLALGILNALMVFMGYSSTLFDGAGAQMDFNLGY